jgi:predicted transcriptional regulator
MDEEKEIEVKESPEKNSDDAFIARVLPEQWAEVIPAYEAGYITAKAISEKFSISPSAVSQYFKRNGVRKNARVKEVLEEAERKVAAKTESFVEKKLQRLEETRTSSYEAVNLMRKLVTNTILKAVKDSLPISSKKNDIVTLNIAILALKNAQEAQLRILDADNITDEEELPGIHIEDLSEKEIRALQQREEEDDFDIVDISMEEELIEEEI